MSNPVPPAQRPGSPALGVPSRTRYYVVVFAIVLAIIQYIDRVAISQAAPLISRDLGLDKAQMAWIFAAFTMAYAAFEIPTGYWGDKMGARRVLIRVVLWWSFFTAATGWVWNFWSLFIVRFLFGAGEAGCFPNIARAFNRWLPRDERVRAQGILWMSARWGGAVAPLLLVLVLQYVNWRRAFEMFAVLGVIWCVFWFRWFRDKPADHPKVNAAELALMPTFEGKSDHPHVPWSVMFSSLSLWLLWLQYFTLSYAWYFFVTWFPTYLNEVHKYDLKVQGALMAGLPLFFGGFGSLFAGYVTPGAHPDDGQRADDASDPRLQRAGARRLLPDRGDLPPAADPRRAVDRPGELLQRHHDARLVDDVHGHRRQVHRHGVRRDEHDGQLRRRRVAGRARLRREGNRQLEPDLLSDGRALLRRRHLLALHQLDEAAAAGLRRVAARSPRAAAPRRRPSISVLVWSRDTTHDLGQDARIRSRRPRDSARP